MKFLIMSDSHGDSDACKRAIRQNRGAEYMIHLGDGEDDIDCIYPELRDMKLVRVRGNCTWFGTAALKYILEAAGKRIYCCHGHMERVKDGLDGLTAAARAEKCDVALYGHTHVQDYHKSGDLVVLNPGSVRGGKYAVMEIDGDGDISARLMDLNDAPPGNS